MKYSIVIATHNRAADLRDTLASLAALVSPHPWEVVVADNNSTDGTRQVVEQAIAGFPVPLTYVFEGVPGRSPALNAAIAQARGDIIVTTDDDVRVEPDWLEQAGSALDTLQCDYIGGRVLPIWGGPRPHWLSSEGGSQWAVVALLDYGTQPFELTSRMPLGVNMAFRRQAFERVGGWDPRVGRKAGTLLGQEVREWCIRARAAGVRGYYAPGLVLQHIVPASRLNRAYFRRWFYWRGISRALLYQQHGMDMENPQGPRIDVARVRHVAGVPRYLYRTAVARAFGLLKAVLRRDTVKAFEHELWLWMFSGIVHQRWRDQFKGMPSAGYSAPGSHAQTAP
jgi:glycosyltransferase involved in cell wall biosynthesis